MIVTCGVHGHVGDGVGGDASTGGDTCRGNGVERNTRDSSDAGGIEHDAEPFPSRTDDREPYPGGGFQQIAGMVDDGVTE